MEFYKEIRKIGNSKGIILPVEILERLRLDEGDVIEISIVHGKESDYIKLDPKKE